MQEEEDFNEGSYIFFNNIHDYHKQLEEKSNQDVRISNIYYHKVRLTDFLIALLLAYGLALSIIANEIKLRDSTQLYTETLLYYNFLATLLLCLTLYIRYKLKLEWHKSRFLEFQFENLYTVGWHKSLAIELLIACMTPYPWLINVKYTEYNKAFDTHL